MPSQQKQPANNSHNTVFVSYHLQCVTNQQMFNYVRQPVTKVDKALTNFVWAHLQQV